MAISTRNLIGLLPISEDIRQANYYVDEDNVIIESVADYLNRVPIQVRVPGAFVVILSSSRYPNTRSISLENFAVELSSYTVKHYYFNFGVTNDCFIEFKSDTMSFEDGARKTGRDAGIYKSISFDDDYTYYCVKGGIAGVAIWKKIAMTSTL